MNNRTQTTQSKQHVKAPRIFAIVDVETTGMRADTGRVIDIGILRIEDGIITKTFQSFIHPGKTIPAYITSINGITDHDVKHAPMFEEIADEILSFFEDAIFVAHNASFDYSFLKREFARIGISFKKPTLCTVQLSRALFPEAGGHSLDALIERFGFSCSARHRALPDAEVIVQFFNYLDRHFGKDIVMKTQDGLIFSDADSLGLLDKKSLIDLPDAPGVYLFYGKEKELLYIGKSKHIRTRVKSHFSADSLLANRKMMGKIARIETRETPGELSALLLESHLIKKELPIYNRLLRKRKEMVVVTERLDDKGYRIPVIERRTTLSAGESVISLFRSMTQARAKLREIAHEHALCEKLLGLEKTDRGCFGMSLGRCRGACLEKETPESYNKRFRSAFKRRRIKTWPFAGGIIVDEKSIQGTGVAFFVRDWKIYGAYRYENGEREEFLPPTRHFDYDTYKLLARYILDSAHKRSIQVISDQEFERALQECSVGNEEEFVYEFA